MWALNLPGLLLLWHALLARAAFAYVEEYQFAVAASLGWLFLSTERWISICYIRRATAGIGEQRATAFRLWAIVGGSFFLVALFRMTYWETMSAFFYIGIAGVYLLGLLRWRQKMIAWVSPEFSLALIAIAPAILMVLANSPFSPFRLLLPILALFFLYFYYLALQCRWAPDEAIPGITPLLNSSAGSFCRMLAIGALLLGAVLGLAVFHGAGSVLLLAAALSVILLCVLETKERSLGSDQCRRLADLALLTPLPALILGW